MRIGIPNEIHAGERRVATTPEVAEQLKKLGFSVAIERGAGTKANFTDDAYREAGAEIIEDTKELWATSDLIFKVRAPERHPELGLDEVELLREGCILPSFLWPAQNPELMARLAALARSPARSAPLCTLPWQRRRRGTSRW